eukprot:TRINITY_DN15936_c0_g1_i1.p1 TRINITY_DN15936_c0_g1~~TRINITY_DN15936_c0_g1_i1.p1  ORF type:complete len:493 (+),score=116.10 TRINITY_DN15936_c0_g1_i1:86-1564(+)
MRYVPSIDSPTAPVQIQWSGSVVLSECSSNTLYRRPTVMHLPPAIDPTLDPDERQSLLSGDDGPRRVSLASVTFNFAKTAMGVGILSIAGTFALSGLAVGLAFVVVSALVAVAAAHMMLDAARIVYATSYEALAEATLGPPARVLVQLSVVIVLFFANLAYIVVSKHFLHTGLSEFGLHIPENVVLIMCVCFVLPLTMLRDLDSLRYTSLFGIAALFVFVIASGAWLATHYGSDAACEELRKTPRSGHPTVPTRSIQWVGSSWEDMLNSFNVIAMSFSWHPAVFPVAEEVVQHDHVHVAHKKLATGSWLAAVVLVLTYESAGVVGYLQWYDTSPWASSIVACYPASQPTFRILYFAMALVCLVSFPLLLHFIRLIFASILNHGESNDLPPYRRVAFNVAFTLITAALGGALNNLITVFAVGGALGLPLMCYIMPPAAFLKAAAMYRNGDALDDAPTPTGRAVVGAWCLLVFGVLLQVGSLYTAARALWIGDG